jgi:integrase
MTGMRRNEVLGLKWPDIDFAKQAHHLNRGLVAVGYEVHQTRGKTKTARRAIALDDTTIAVLAGWRAFQAAEFAAVGIDPREQWVFTDGDGEPVHPHAVYEAFRRIVNNAGTSPDPVPRPAAHPRQPAHQRRRPGQGRVSERLGHANIAFTMQTYQHVLPGMQEDAADTTRTTRRSKRQRPARSQRRREHRGKTPVVA